MAVEYREFLAVVSKSVELDRAEARTATKAALGVLARVLDENGWDRLHHAFPGELREDLPVGGPARN